MMSPAHWVIVVLIIVLLFGSSKIAEVGKGLGEGIRSFKKGLADTLDDPEKEAAKAKQIRAEEEKPNNA